MHLPQNNTAQLYFILGRTNLCWNFSSKPKNGSDIQLEKFQDLPKGSGSLPYALLEICEYQRHLKVNWKNSNIGQHFLIYEHLQKFCKVLLKNECNSQILAT